MKKTILAAALTAVALPAAALEKMPEPGWGGFVDLGVGTGNIETNFLARIPGIDADLSDQTISTFDSPDDENYTVPAIGYSFGYTFDSGKTRIFLGSDLSDFLQFDSSTKLALRHDFDTLGRFQLALLAQSYPGVEVWEDPYLLDAKRDETESSSTGGRITWDKIFGSQFELKLTSRERDIDDERSGESLVADGTITASEARLLDREGDKVRAELGYLFNIDGGRHILRPSIAYVDFDLDGDAMAQDGYEVGLSYLFNASNFRMAANALYQDLDGDEENPIFNEVNDAEVFAVGAQFFFPGAFGLDKWVPKVGMIYADSDSDIDFNDSTGWLMSAGMYRSF